MTPIIFWPSVPLKHRSRLPAKSGLYAVRCGFLTFYVGKSNNIQRRWERHHRYPQAARLPWCRLSYYTMPESRIHGAEAKLIKQVKKLPWNWNGDDVPDRVDLFLMDAGQVLIIALVMIVLGVFAKDVLLLIFN